VFDASRQPEQALLIHTPLEHDCVLPQTEQLPPPEPQAKMVFEGVMQVPFGAQHPPQLAGPQP